MELLDRYAEEYSKAELSGTFLQFTGKTPTPEDAANYCYRFGRQMVKARRLSVLKLKGGA